MRFSALYVDIVTGPAEGLPDRYTAPVDGRTANHVVKAEVEGPLVGAWYTLQEGVENLPAFSLLDVIPYLQARDRQLFESPEAEALHPGELDRLFILRLRGVDGQEHGIPMTLKVNLLHE